MTDATPMQSTLTGPADPSPADSAASGQERVPILTTATLLGIEALAVSISLWLGSLGRDVYTLASNGLDADALRAPLWLVIACAAVTWLICMVYGARKEHRARRAQSLSMLALPLLVSPWIAIGFNWPLWESRPLPFLVFFLIGSLGLERCLTAALSCAKRDLGPWLVRSRLHRRCTALLDTKSARYLPLVLVGLASTAYAVYFSYHTLAFHWNGHTSTYDLAIEENVVWQTLHGGPLFASTPIYGPLNETHFSRHATFVAFLIAPFYALSQRAETLLVLQSVLLGGAAIPLFLSVQRYVNAWTSALICLAYLLYAPLHGAHLYDFHFLTLAPPFVFCLFWAVDSRRRFLSALFLVLTLSVREDVAFAVSAMGAYFLFCRRRLGAGLGLLVTAIGYFVAMKLFIMPHERGTPSFLEYYAGILPPGSKGFSDILETIFLNPAFTIQTVLREDKLIYALQVLSPLALLPLRSKSSLILLAPAVLPTLLTQGGGAQTLASLMISFQYTAHWTSCVFLAAAITLHKIAAPQHASDNRATVRLVAACGALAFSTLGTSYQFGAILQQHTAKTAFEPFPFGTSSEDLARRADRSALIAQIPADARIAASERELPHVANRRWAYTLRSGVFDADYILVSYGLPWCREDDLIPVRHALLDGSFGVAEIRDHFALLRRGHPNTSNAALLDLLIRR
jgi:uncharacterized membrane protein